MNTNNNITFVIGNMLQGGAERVVANLSASMAEQGLDVVILSYYDEESVYALHPEVKLIKIQRETGSDNIVKNTACIRRYFKQRQGRIYSFLALFNILSVIAHTGLKSRLIVADRNTPDKDPKRLLLRIVRNFLYRFADLIVVQTEANGEYFRRRMSVPVERIYNPLELNGRNGQALQTEKKDLIVSVGRLDLQKNHKMLLHAFQKIHTRFPTYHLVIYGEGPLRAETKRLAEELGLPDCVHMPGNCADIYDRIMPAKLFVLSSDFEGMSNALVEAMGLGLPVISTKVSGAVDLIRNGYNGELVDVGDVDMLAERMRVVLSDAELQKKYGENAVEICEMLSMEKITEQWMNLGR